MAYIDFADAVEAHSSAHDERLQHIGLLVSKCMPKWLQSVRYDDVQKEGAYGEVFKVASPDGRAYAVKIIRQRVDDGRESEEAFRRRVKREATIAERLGREGVAPRVHWHGVCRANASSSSQYMIVSDWCGLYTWAQFWRDKAGDAAARHHALELLLKAVQAMHKHGVVHLDLHPSNILLCIHGGRLRLFLTDFGWASATSQPWQGVLDSTSAAMREASKYVLDTWRLRMKDAVDKPEWLDAIATSPALADLVVPWLYAREAGDRDVAARVDSMARVGSSAPHHTVPSSHDQGV